MKKPVGLFVVLASLLVPISWGLGLYFLLCTAIETRWLDHELLRRYVLGHPVSKITTAMLCVGLAALVQTLSDCLKQLHTHRQIQLTDDRSEAAATLTADASAEEHRQLPADQADAAQRAVRLAANLNKLSRQLQTHLLFRRLQAILSAIGRTGPNESAAAEMRHLSEADAVQSQQRHALVRILIWATPMLGFLGTVMGISQALGNLNIGPENDLQSMMGGLQASLYVAFDTTALALVFSMLLMFSLFFVERVEGQLLRLVDERAQTEIDRYFEFSGPANESHALLQSWGRRVLAATRKAVREHVEIWRHSMQSAEASWSTSRDEIAEETKGLLVVALRESLSAFAESIGQTIDQCDQRLAQRWQQWQTMLSDAARQLDDRQRLTIHQAQAVSEILSRLENLASIQQSIDRGLESLAATTRLDSSLNALTQAIGQLRTDLRMEGLPDPVRAERPLRVRPVWGTRRAA